MATFKSKEELLKAIEVGFEAINQGTINLEQMDELVNSARDLYERTVIIRHKSLELLVANQSVSFEKDVHETVAPVIEHATPAFATEELIIEEPLTPSEDETPILVANDVVEDKSEFTSSSSGIKKSGYTQQLWEFYSGARNLNGYYLFARVKCTFNGVTQYSTWAGRNINSPY